MNRGQASDRIIKAALPMGQKLTLLVYLMHQSSKDSPETGVSWPALPTLALHLQMSRSFVIEARKALTDAKILIADAPGKGEATRYRIDFDRIPALSEEESGAYKNKIREHKSPRGVQRVHPRGPDPTPQGVQDVDPQGSSVDTPRGPDSTPRGSSPYTRTVSMEPFAVDPSPGNHHQGNLLQGTGGAQVVANLTGSPPPAEPSGSSFGLPMAGLSKMETPAEPEDLDAWRASHTAAHYPLSAGLDEFEPVSDPYTFEDAHHDGIAEQPSIPRQIESPAARAPETPPQGPRPSPTRQGNGEGAPEHKVAPPRSSAAQPSLWPAEARLASGEGEGSPPAPDASGGPAAGAPVAKPKRTPKEAPTPREPAPPVELDHPDDPCPLLLGAKVSVDHLTADIVEVYRSWWRRQLSPATCRLTAGRLGLIRQALGTYEAAQLVHLVRYAYEAADLGKFGRAWRGDNGQTPPDLEMLLRGEHVARNVEMAGRWTVERVPGAPPAAGPAPSNVHPFQMPPPPAPRAPFRKATTAELMQALANM